jgi:predicted  nucleic acid-binding Zn-ribbon protein
MSDVNLASEENAKRINQRFKEYELEVLELKKQIVQTSNTIATLNNKVDSMARLYQEFFVKQYGTGPTERSE